MSIRPTITFNGYSLSSRSNATMVTAENLTKTIGGKTVQTFEVPGRAGVVVGAVAEGAMAISMDLVISGGDRVERLAVLWELESALYDQSALTLYDPFLGQYPYDETPAGVLSITEWHEVDGVESGLRSRYLAIPHEGNVEHLADGIRISGIEFDIPAGAGYADPVDEVAQNRRLTFQGDAYEGYPLRIELSTFSAGDEISLSLYNAYEIEGTVSQVLWSSIRFKAPTSGSVVFIDTFRRRVFVENGEYTPVPVVPDLNTTWGSLPIRQVSATDRNRQIVVVSPKTIQSVECTYRQAVM